MKINDLFEKINNQILEKDLIKITAENWESFKNKLNAKISYDRLCTWFNKRGLIAKNLYYVERVMYPLWYIDNYACMTIFSLEDEKALDIMQVSERVVQVNKRAEEEVANNNYCRLLGLVDQQFVIYMLNRVYNKIPKDQLYEVFVHIYSHMEYDFNYLSREILEDVFSNKPKNRRAPIEDEVLTIYRGEGEKSTPINKALSWTTCINVALFFANRFDSNGKVYRAKIRKENILAYITHRGEEEVVAMPESVFEIEDLEYMTCSNEQMTKWQNEGIFEEYNYYKQSIQEEWFFAPDNIHGILHTKRVLLLSLLISHHEGFDDQDKEIMAYCSIFHDIGRMNECEDEEHGYRSVKKIGCIEDLKDDMYLDDEEYAIMEFIIEYHCKDDDKAFEDLNKNTKVKDKQRAIRLIKAFKDADNLDRVRISDLDVSYLRTDTAKKLPLVATIFLKNIK